MRRVSESPLGASLQAELNPTSPANSGRRRKHRLRLLVDSRAEDVNRATVDFARDTASLSLLDATLTKNLGRGL